MQTTHWYLVHTKPRQERRALDNLCAQGYHCYLPEVTLEKVVRGRVTAACQPLFPRYLFIALSQGLQSQSWGPIRSTLGVTKLVSFGAEPARVPPGLVEQLQVQLQELKEHAQPLFQPGQRVLVTKGPFAGLESVYQMPDSDARAIVLLELMHRPVRVPVPVDALTAVA